MCIKCGSGRITGPVYGKGAHGDEWLSYKCSNCGYSYRTATADETKSADARIQWAQQMRTDEQAKKSLM